MRLITALLMSRALWAAALLLAATSAILFGVVGIGRGGGVGRFDSQYYYFAGRCLWQGLSAYDPAVFAECGRGSGMTDVYAYPPHFGIFGMLLSLFSLSGARILMSLINFASIASLAVMLSSAPKHKADFGVPHPAPEARWLIPAIVLGNPFTTHILWMGQTDLIVTAALAGAWLWSRRGNFWLAGVLMGIATIKPQLSIFFVCWFVLEARWRELTVGAGFALVMALPEILANGPIDLIPNWLAVLQRYSLHPLSSISFVHTFGIRSFLGFFISEPPSMLPLAVLGFAGLWLYRKRLSDQDVPALLTALTLLTLFAQTYSLVALVLMLPSFWRRLRGRDGQATIALSLMLLLFVPQRFFRVDLTTPLIPDFRVVIVAVLMAWLLALNLQQSAGRGPRRVEESPAGGH